MNINYKLFSPDGRPLRATINANFQEVIYNGLDRRKPPTESPDVTHGRTIKDGDTLPQMVRQIYGDEYYYLAVAKENKLIQFRNLRPGNSIYFPPIKKN